MRFTIPTLSLGALVTLSGCPQPERVEKRPEKTVVIEAPRSALSVIREVHTSLEGDCGRHLNDVKLKGIRELDLFESEQEEADKLLADIGLFAQQCGSYLEPALEAGGCDPDCSWCPIKWYWCIENAGACAGGDNKSCCKLGACGSKHHCEKVCKSSCGCDVPPLPSDGGGDGADE